MRFPVSIAAALLLGVTVLTACNSNEHLPSKIASAASSTPPAQLPPGDSARRITPAELKDELSRNNAVIIDVRNDASYKAGHIKGARLIPATDILSHLDELPRDKMIVTYCS